MKTHKRVTHSNVLSVFQYFFSRKESNKLRQLLFIYVHKRLQRSRNINMKDITNEIVINSIKSDEFFKRVADHVNLHFKDNTYLDNYYNGNDTILDLAKQYVDLEQKFAEETIHKTNSHSKTSEEIKNTLEGRTITKAISTDKETSEVAKQYNDLNLVYRWYDLNTFKGRENQREQLIDELLSNNFAIIDGIRGIGKTSLVQAYLTEQSDKYKNIIWITVYDNITHSLLNCFSQMQQSLPHSVLPVQNNKEDTLGHCLKQLSLILGKNLIIIDNANCEYEIKEFINKSKEIAFNWNIIFTTNSGIKNPVAIQLHGLDKDKAFELFCSYYNEDKVNPKEKEQANHFISDNKDKLHSLLRLIDYHPLLIELIAKTDIEDELLDLAYYAELLTSIDSLKAPEFDRQIIVKVSDPAYSKLRPAERTPYNYIKAIFEKDLLHLSPEEQYLLQQFAILPSAPLPVEDLHMLSDIPLPQLMTVLHKLRGWIKYDHTVCAYIMAELNRFAVREILKTTQEQIANMKEKIHSFILKLEENIEEQNNKRIRRMKMYLNEMEIFENRDNIKNKNFETC